MGHCTHGSLEDAVMFSSALTKPPEVELHFSKPIKDSGWYNSAQNGTTYSAKQRVSWEEALLNTAEQEQICLGLLY